LEALLRKQRRAELTGTHGLAQTAAKTIQAFAKHFNSDPSLKLSHTCTSTACRMTCRRPDLLSSQPRFARCMPVAGVWQAKSAADVTLLLQSLHLHGGICEDS
jgi:hypothetical protein